MDIEKDSRLPNNKKKHELSGMHLTCSASDMELLSSSKRKVQYFNRFFEKNK